MHTPIRVLSILLVFVAIATPGATQHSQMPAGMTHEEHLAQLKKDAELKERGLAAMGFDQDKTEHHFRLTKTGGAIEVTVRNSGGDLVRSQVRAHLQDIASEFAAGRLAKPLATHAEVPPGAETMERLSAKIGYMYEDVPDGGRVVIATRDRRAKNAVREFLRYQIREHRTGDPLIVSE